MDTIYQFNGESVAFTDLLLANLVSENKLLIDRATLTKIMITLGNLSQENHMVKVHLLKSSLVSDFLQNAIYAYPSPETIQEILNLYISMFQG